MSAIGFERRVLEEARDARNPLLERVKFLGILGRNLDELVMRGRDWIASPAGRRLTRSAHALACDGQRVLERTLVPALAGAGIHVIEYGALDASQRANVERYFVERVLPLITPLYCDAAPVVDAPSLGLNIAVVLERPSTALGTECQPSRLAIVRMPEQVSSLLRVDSAGGDTFTWLRQAVLANVHRVFPGALVVACHLFRIVRDADIVLERADADELPERTIEAVRQRETNPILMMVIDRTAGPALIDRLARALRVEPEAIVTARAVLDLRRLWDFMNLGRPDLQYPALAPDLPLCANGPGIFASIRKRDILLHHPFESFEPVIRFAQQAASDPVVERISATLYRTDRGESPIGEALLEAARRGKHVRVVVELKARFDERRNAEWSRALHAAGAQVIHAPAGLKVHAKTLLIERREADCLRRYTHVSSGNYSAFTSRAYTDFGLLTCDEAIAYDVAELFDMMAGEGPVPALRAVIAAPYALRRGFRRLVEREMTWARLGEAAHIILKMNALLDQAAIDLLHRACHAGVQVDLIVRGAAALQPGIPGVSDRIRVRSIVGRFLEHSRAWYSRNGGADDVFIGSADLRPRNFDRRVEMMVPLKDRALAHRLRYEILNSYLMDTLSARELLSNGRYRRVVPRPGEPRICCQSALLDLKLSGADARRTDGVDHRASHLTR